MGAEKIILAVFFATYVAVILAADPLCDGLPDDEVFPFPHETNCSLYYECLNGDKTLLACNDGLYYNNKTQACDFPAASGCTNVDNACVGKDLDYLPHPEDCSQYIECYQGDSYLMNCPTGYYFDSKSKMCVLPEKSDCGTSTSNTPPWTTPHPLCWGVKPNQTVLRPYDGDCSKYWQCTGSNLELKTCPGGLLFDEDRQMCDFPDLVPCDDTTRTPDPNTVTPPIPSTTPTPDHDPRCVDGSTSYWPHPEYCHWYIECYGSNSYEMECPPGLDFSSDVQKCVDPRDSDCDKRSTPTDKPTITTPDNWTPDPDCPYPDSEGKLLPYPGDCTKYYECAEGRKVEMPCPAGLWFNQDTNECDYPYQSNCPWAPFSLLSRLSNYFKWF